MRAILLLAARWQVTGRENIPQEGPLLVVANHLNLADPPLISVSLTRKVMFMAKEELFRSGFSSFVVRSFGAFPVRRSQADRKALRQAEKVLSDGLALVMFPEASRSPNGQLQAAFPGATMIALRCNVPILPVGISGTEKLVGPFWMLQRPRITVNIGPTFRLPSSGSKTKKPELSELTNLIMNHIAELLPQSQRGIYVKQKETNAPVD